jgi:hypothetical protein
VKGTGQRDGPPVLITEAAPSFDDEHAARRRKYAIMMGLRIPCLILAGIFYQTWWLAVLFVLVSVPLPWMAVLIANDRPPRKAEHVSRYRPHTRELESGERHVIGE